MNTKVEYFLEEYLSTHPEFDLPPIDRRHPARLVFDPAIKSWMFERFGSPLNLWRAVFESAKEWFPVGGDDPEFGRFDNLFQFEGNVWWNGHEDLEALAREFNSWATPHRKSRASSRVN